MKELTSSVVDPEDSFWQQGEDGIFRLYDIASGEVLQMLGPDALISKMPMELAEIERADGVKVLVQRNVSLDVNAVGKGGRRYSPILADLMCQAIANGDSPLTVAEKYDVRYALLSAWKRRYPEFAEKFNQALQDRADFLADRALIEAEAAPETMAGTAKAKLVVDTLWRSAEVANAKKYSPRMKLDSAVTVPIQIVIETGFRDRKEGSFNVDETAKIRDAQEVKSPSVATLEGAGNKLDTTADALEPSEESLRDKV